jgi:DNA helicase-2/ATP-dependent DNA helicase PcrA
MNFTEIFNNLNPAQSKAANTLEGAIMVIAGAGTGKTQTLAARAANMLRAEQMIDPQNILALTFTDAASYAMRKRLVDMVGTEAYRMGIYTFHAWCNEIIQDNSYLFGINDLEPASELEINNIIKVIIDEIPKESVLYRLKGEKYFELPRLKNLFSYMKRENMDYEIISYKVKRYLDDLPTREEYIYKKNGKDYKQGDIKFKAIAEETLKMNYLLEGANMLCRYDELMQDSKRYDFDDMIRWVIVQFQSNDNLLRNYQERYQYIMIDEFQDTNGSQMKLIELLASYWENPNLFVVGDDDQTIYEFGGARLKNMKDFLEKYKAEMIFLNENYRSDQSILDVAGRVIEHNSQRILPIKNLTSHLVCNPVIYLCEAANIMNEEAFVFGQVTELIKIGIEPGDIAVLFRKHRQGENLIRMFKNTGIPVNVKRSIDILTEPIVLHLIKMVNYFTVSDPSAKMSMAFEIMHYPYFGNNIQELHAIQIQGKFWVYPGLEKLDHFVTDFFNLPVVKFLEKLTYELIMPYILKHKNRTQLNLFLSTLFEFVKGEAFKKPSMTAIELVNSLQEMINESVRLNVMDVNTDETGVFCSTVHGAKGLEWKHVYLIGCQRNEWEKSRAGATSYKLPDTITNGSEEDAIESNRRLFYVAITRAKTNLIVSYSKKDNFNKDLEPSQFVIESELSPVHMDEIDLNPVMEASMSPEKKLLRAEKQFLEYAIPDTYMCSISAVNKYLECQVAFYYENVLKAPFVANEALIYGNAIHEALLKLYIKAKEAGMSKEEFQSVFHLAMMKYEGQIKINYLIKRLEEGIRILNIYYTEIYPTSNKITLCEFTAKVVLPNGVPFKYIFDKIEFDGNTVYCPDYKTGKRSGVIEALKDDGHYKRQMVSAKLTIDSMHGKAWKFGGARIDLFDEVFESIDVPITPLDEVRVLDDIYKAYNGIIQHKFTDGCGVCKWCQMEETFNNTFKP